MGNRPCPSSGRRRRRVLRLPAQPRHRHGSARRPRSPRPRRCWPARPGRSAPRGRARTWRRRAISCATPASPSPDPRYEEAFRLAVESQSYSRRTLGGSGAGEQGDASFIFVEGDVVAAARGTLDLRAGAPARAALRRRLRQGRARRARPRSCSTTGRSTRSARARSSSAAGRLRRRSTAARSRSISGAVNVYTSGSTSTVATDTATAAIDRDSRVSVDVAPGDKTEVTSFRGRTTVSTGKESVILEGREKVAAEAKTRHVLARRSPCRTRRSRRCRRTTGSTT